MTNINVQDIADDLIRHLDEWYSLPEVWDNELDTQIHKWYAEAKNVWPKRPYFSPSAANSDQRELYYKQLRAEVDIQRKPPYQGRWTSIGTAIGDVIQRDILAMERNMGTKGNFPSRFRFERNKDGTPMFEDFAKKNTKVTYNGFTFYLYGTCDGIMEYAHPETGEIIRIGLEVKSKQTSAAKTSFYSMREPDPKHVKQVYMYGEMYNVDYYIILYVNASKKAWVYQDGDYEKNPDIRAFGVNITQERKDEVFEYLTEVLQSVQDMDPPALDPEKWTFNKYKTIIALEMTDEEVDDVRRKKNRIMRSGQPKFIKDAYVECLDFILRVREERANRGDYFGD